MSLRWISITVLAASVGLTGCSSTTQEGATGVNRKQLLLVSSEEVNAMSSKSYQDLLAQARQKNVLNRDAAMVARLRRIANHLIPHVSTFRADARGWQWEVNTIQSNELNAFVMPGGKVMFYSGIISRLQLTDAEIAAIMGHEIAHALREHARERISRDVAQQTGLGLLASVVGLTEGQAQAAGMAAQLGLQLPHSRAQEEEADVLGLELMARAGYNPQAALTLWQKMRQASQGEPPKFLSTHPSTGDRIGQIQQLLPRVMPIYQQGPTRR